MQVDDPFPSEQLADEGFAQMVTHLCARPGMYVGKATFSAVTAYIEGFNAARGGGPLLGFREWLVVKANTGNNLHWTGLMKLLNPASQEVGSDQNLEEHWIHVTGSQIHEYLRYREANGITKVYYQYGQWLLRKRWYRGPLRKKDK